MKISLAKALLLSAILLGVTASAHAAVIDVVEAPTGYFVPTDAEKYDAPYYRWQGEDGVTATM